MPETNKNIAGFHEFGELVQIEVTKLCESDDLVVCATALRDIRDMSTLFAKALEATLLDQLFNDVLGKAFLGGR